MRKDMKKVVGERHRTGGHGGKVLKGSKKRLHKTPLEEQINRESTAPGRAHGYDCKRTNFHLAPLRRWLRSQVGRNWNEVWSEICNGLKIESSNNYYIRSCVEWCVDKSCYVDEDGEIRTSQGFALGAGYRWHGFYVDPTNNILCELPRSRRRQYSVEKDWVPGKDENHRYYLLNDSWFEVILKPYHDEHHYLWDMVISAQWENKKPYTGSRPGDCRQKYGRAVYAAEKRQLSKKEIRRLKLRD